MHPTIIVTLWTDVGLHEGITIHDKSGGLIHIRFHEPASPELSDNWITRSELKKERFLAATSKGLFVGADSKLTRGNCCVAYYTALE
jgi:hypothetical protein